MAPPEKPLEPWKGPWHLLGYVVQSLRKANGESLRTTAQSIPISHQTVSHWEHAEYQMDVKYCRMLDARWKTGGLLVMLHNHASNPDRDFGWFGEYLGYQAQATMIRSWDVSWIPGLLQTEGYAHGVLVAGRSKTVEEEVVKRLARQEILTGDRAPHLSALLDEAVLLRLHGAMGREQLAHLLECSDMPNVQIRLVPLSAGLHVGLNGSFQIITTPKLDVGYEEFASASRLVTDSREVHELAISFDRIGGDALTRESTQGRINEMVREL